jgi:hypothetical protein
MHKKQISITPYDKKGMLGDQIAEIRGKVTGQRVLDAAEGPKVEYSFTASGTMKGIEITHMATFYTVPKGNALYGQGQGVITTRDGSGEMATETGQGIGKFTDDGKKVMFRGSFFYKASSSGKLAFLNNIVGVFEYEGDELGNTFYKVWEWK